MNNQNKQKLLILGAYNTEIEIVNAAHEMGIYTIVTDNHPDYNDAPAKRIADEVWNISWSDIEILKSKCIENKVTGCFAGFSERRIICANKLSRVLNSHFYAENSKLETICNKNAFKEACISSGIKVPHNYTNRNEIKFPVIVKPADNGGSNGITICYNEQELDNAIEKAKLASDTSNIIIEEYLTGEETMVYLSVHNGIVETIAMCDRYMKSFNKNITQLPIGYYFPSKHLKTFIDFNLEKFKNLIYELKINNGLIAFQSFVINNDVIPFDPTFRLDGTMSYHITDAINKSNILKQLINFSITGSMGNDQILSSTNNPYFDKIGFEYPILLGKGKITKIIGLETIKNMPNVIHVFIKHDINDLMLKAADFSQMLCRIHLLESNKENLIKDITRINKTLSVLDEKNNEMIINKLDLNTVLRCKS